MKCQINKNFNTIFSNKLESNSMTAFARKKTEDGEQLSLTVVCKMLVAVQKATEKVHVNQ